MLPFSRGPKESFIRKHILGFLKISRVAAALSNGKYLYSISYNTSPSKQHPHIIRLFSVHKM
jgi:hypothetical protein